MLTKNVIAYHEVSTIAAVIETWPKPNYLDPPRRAWLPAYAGVLQAVTTLMVGTRLWLRLQRKAGTLGLDDVFARE